MQVAAVAAQVQDGITDELPGAVEGDVAAALHLENGQVARLAHVARARVPAQRHDRRVLEQQDHVPPQPTLDPRLGERPLPLERLLVRHQAGLDHVNRAVSHSASPTPRPRLPRPATALAAPPPPRQPTPHTASPPPPTARPTGEPM